MAKTKNNKTKNIKLDELKTLADEKKENITKEETVRTGKVNVDKLRLRTAPNTESNIIKYLQKGETLKILEDVNADFYKVNAGFVMKKFIDIM